MKKLIKILILTLVCQNVLALKKTEIYDSIYKTDQEHIGDVLYLHGLGDNLENHPRLFKKWNDKGYNVISFDYPDHGRTFTASTDDLNLYTLKRLSKIAERTLNKYREDSSKKLVIAGWSTGGILAIRAIQDYFSKDLVASVNSLILYAPGVAVKLCPGNKFCNITNETLTDDEQLYNRTIYPRAPLLKAAFGLNLMLEGKKSFRKIPSHINTLVFSASMKDHYVKTYKIHNWVKFQRRIGHKNMSLTHCPKSRHELDNNLDSSGSKEVRDESASFLVGLKTDKKICKTL
jgi:alpha-beta hydrolase superfamily lysophospholipase